MTRFEECMAFVFGREGGKHDGTGINRFDRGGATSYGVTQDAYSAYLARHHLPIQPIGGITRDEAKELYREDYWQSPGFALLPRPLDLVCFDAGVNCGTRTATRFLQAALGVKVDGVLGNKTLAAAVADSAEGVLPAVVAACLDERRGHYDRICKTDPSQRRFYRGWMARCDHLQQQTEVA